MDEHYNIMDLIRSDPRGSFHAASESYLRIEFFKMTPGGSLGPFTYGVVVLTCYQGQFRVDFDNSTEHLRQFDQIVLASGTEITVSCEEQGTLQVIWTFDRAATTQG